MKVQKNKNKLQNNIIKLFFGVIIAILVLIGRYGWVQLVEGDQMMARLKGQVQEESVLHVMTKEEILERIGRGGGFVWLKRQMEPEMTNAVKNLIKQKPEYNACLGFRQESKRYYPNDMLAANVLGFVGTDDKGLDGIEQQFDSMIKGEDQEASIFTDALACRC